METKDPFDLLMDAGSSPDLWVLIGGPALLLLLLIAVYATIVFIRGRRERRELTQEMELEDKGGRRSVKGGAPKETSPEDYEDDAQPYEIPEGLEQEDETDNAFEPAAKPFKGAEEFEREPAKVLPLRPKKSAPPEEKTAPAPASEVDDIRLMGRDSWLKRLRGGLAKTRDSLSASISSIFTGKIKLDQSVLERLHEALYRADIGGATTDKLVDHVRETLGKDEAADWEAVRQALKERAQTLMADTQSPLPAHSASPWVILIVGVNGAGKTTTIGKLAANFLAQDKKVLLCAGDTFRAAAIEQLTVWGDRLGVDVIKHQQGSDPAAVAYDGVKAAIARKADVLLIDTAGRLHSKNELMDELGKIKRVIGKDLPGAPHDTWLVIDATTGQNAVAQVKAFREVVPLTGLVVTKLDGTAKGGVILGISDQFQMPVRYVGVGEKAADLRDFNAKDYVDSLF